MQVIMELERCPGLYCGRTYYDNGTLSVCGACPRGFRTNEQYICIACDKDLTDYDWYYLGFMAILPLLINWILIDIESKQRVLSKEQVTIFTSALFEIVASAILVLIINKRRGHWKITSCGVEKLADWYTLFHNPTPNYTVKIHCTQEAVYPLQTIILQLYLFCMITMILIRPVLNAKFVPGGKSAVYSSLYIFPVLIFLHALSGGLIYYSFPYLSIIISMASNACHYSIKLDQNMKSLVKSTFMEVRNMIVIVGHWLLLAYGIVALKQNYFLLAFIPFPSFFYIFTVRFTDPSEFIERDERSG